jgi:predicted dinucleotide-binding enzyme
MEIGIIGAGAFAQAFAKRALKAGHKTKLSNSRGPDSLRQIVNQLGPGATAASKEEAAEAEAAGVPSTSWKGTFVYNRVGPSRGMFFV